VLQIVGFGITDPQDRRDQQFSPLETLARIDLKAFAHKLSPCLKVQIVHVSSDAGESRR
jgi:hypothetical protein